MKVLTLEMMKEKTAALRKIEQYKRTLHSKQTKRSLLLLKEKNDFNSNKENSFDDLSDSCTSVITDSSSCNSENSSLLSLSPSPPTKTTTLSSQYQQYNHSNRIWNSNNKNKSRNFKIDNKGYKNHSNSNSNNSSSNSQQKHYINNCHNYVAMDCEMVGIGYDGQQSMLARVTIIDGNCSVLFDRYIKPTSKIVDYRTFVSGILPEHLDDEHNNAETALLDIATCRAQVLHLLRNKILVGHALKNDLNALGIFHPWHQIRDTAQWVPFMKIRFNDGHYWPRKLKELVRENLFYEIQNPRKPHCPYEDATAALQLYRCVQQEWEQAIAQKVIYQKTQYNIQQHSNSSINRGMNQHQYCNNYSHHGRRQIKI